jgi:hypothetical protein
MERLALQLALHGALVLISSLVAGLLLHRTIRLGRDVAPWHLAHAGGSGRGVMLIALAAILHWVALPPAPLSAFVWLMIAFAWSSMAAMLIAAATGERGVTWSGSATSRLVFGLYVVSAVTVFPAAFLLVAGLIRALSTD